MTSADEGATDRARRWLHLSLIATHGFCDPLIDDEMDRLWGAMRPAERDHCEAARKA